MEYPCTGGEAIFTFSPCLCLCLGFGLCPGLLLIQVPLQSLLPLLCLFLFLLPLFLLLQSFRLHLLFLLQPLFLCPCVLLLSGFLLLLLLLLPRHLSLCGISLTLTLNPTLPLRLPLPLTVHPMMTGAPPPRGCSGTSAGPITFIPNHIFIL